MPGSTANNLFSSNNPTNFIGKRKDSNKQGTGGQPQILMSNFFLQPQKILLIENNAGNEANLDKLKEYEKRLLMMNNNNNIA